MKIKVSELQGAALDWAVAKCEGIEVRQVEGVLVDPLGLQFSPSIDWSYGGMVIEREGVQLRCGLGGWVALPYDSAFSEEAYQEGDTPLVAAMRCYVASKLGDEIELPEELDLCQPQHK